MTTQLGSLRRQPEAEWVQMPTPDAQIAAHAKRLALELECLLLSCDTAATSKWWDSAHEALAQYQADLAWLYPQPRVSAFGKD